MGRIHLQCWAHGFNPWLGNWISHAVEQRSPRATTKSLCAARKGPIGCSGNSRGLQSRSDAARKKKKKTLFSIVSLTLQAFLSYLRCPGRASRQRGWGTGRAVGMCPAITSTAKLSSFPSSLIFSCNLSVRQRLVQLLEKQPRVCVREAAKR